MNDLVKTGEYTAVNKNYMAPLNPRVAAINAQIASSPLASQGISQAPSAITSASLQSVQPFSIPQIQTSTTADGIIGLSQGILDTTKASRLAEEAAIREQQALAAKEESKTGLKSLMERITGVQASRGALEGEQKVAEKTQKVTDVTNQIESVQRALQNELKAIDQVGTLTDVQKYARKAEINRQYGTQLADLSIIQSAANRDLVTAQNIVDRKIEIQLEPLKTQLDFAKLFYEDNKDSLTKAEDRAFQTKIKDDERVYQSQKDELTAISSIQLEALRNGAPAEVALNIGRQTNRLDAARIAGQYLVKPTAPKVSTGNPAIDSTIQTYADLLAQGKISLSNVPQNVRNAVVVASEGIINKPLSDTAISQITQTQSAIENLQALKNVVQNNLQFIGPIEGLQRLNPYSEARQVQAEVDRVRQVVGKALEGGVLRKEDEEKYKKILATLSDTPETAIYKIDALISQLERDITTYRANQAASGRYVGETASLPKAEDLRSKYNY